MSETKREDHPLWGAFKKWLADGNVVCSTCEDRRWPAFLAGADALNEAAEAAWPHARPVSIVEGIAANEVFRLHKRLDAAFELSHKMAAKIDRLMTLVDKGVKVEIQLKTPPTE